MAKNAIEFYQENSVNISFRMDVDLTGSTIYFTAKPDYDDDQMDAAAIIKKDVTTHLDAPNGISRMFLSAQDTSKPAGKYVYDFKIKFPDATEQRTLAVGKLTIKSAVTQRG